MHIGEELSPRNKWALGIAGALFAALVGVADYTTGRDISFSLFYLIPIALAAWFVGGWAGITISIVSTAAWFIADYLWSPLGIHLVILVWNAAVRLSVFVVLVFVLAKLRAALIRERTLSRTDPLTGVENSRSFYDLARAEIERARRYRYPLTVAYVDVDDFKQINDRFGHRGGDDLLLLVAQTVRENIRSSDLIARLGGDEFALLFPETGPESAWVVLNKLRSVLLEGVRRKQWPVTFSFGVATYVRPPDSVEDMIRQADDLMYAAKRAGKDRIQHEVWEEGGG